MCWWHAEYLAEQHQRVHADNGYVTPARVEFSTCLYGLTISQMAAPPDFMLAGMAHIAYCSLATFKSFVYFTAFYRNCWLCRLVGGQGTDIVGEAAFHSGFSELLYLDECLHSDCKLMCFH